MSINNLETIKHLLTFESEDDFYFLQIVLRRKEVPTLKKNSYIIKSYYITSVKHLEKLMESEIIPICNALNARAYINLGLRSFERNSLETLRKVTENLINKNFEAVKAVYDSACGSYTKNKLFLFDIDSKSIHNLDLIKSQIPNDKYLITTETKQGYHIITKPFDTRNIKGINPEDIKKNNPTLLYT